jgi:hypothetical protein
VVVSGRVAAIPVDASGNLTAKPAGAWKVIVDVLAVGLIGSMLAWLAVQVPRYRRSAGERRQQLKWLYGGAIVFVTAASTGPVTTPRWS